MIRLIKYEFINSSRMLFILMICYISMVISATTLISIAIPMRHNYYKAYGNSYFILENMDYSDFNTLPLEKCVLDVYDIENYTKDLITGNKSFFQFNELKIDTFFSCAYDILNDEVIINNGNSFNPKYLDKDKYVLYDFNGVYRNIGLKGSTVEVEINSIISQVLKANIGDEISFFVDDTETKMVVSKVYDYRESNYSFICSLNFFDNRIMAKSNKVRMTLIDNSDYLQIKAYLDDNGLSYLNDKSFERYDSTLRMVTFILYSITLVILFLFIFGMYSIINNIISSRLFFIKKLELMGAANSNIFSIYYFNYLIVFLFGLVPSYFISLIIVNKIQTVFVETYNMNFTVSSIYFVALVLFFIVNIISIICILLIINSKKKLSIKERGYL